MVPERQKIQVINNFFYVSLFERPGTGFPRLFVFIMIVMKNKKVKLDKLLSHIGKSDITYLVNFNLLKEYFEMKNLTVKNIVTQKFFLEKMGIIERAKILEKNMNNKEKCNMFLTLKRLLDKKFMGELFKVIFAFKSETDNYLGFN